MTRALVIGDAPLGDPRAYSPDILAGADLIVAADGGARRALSIGLRPDLVIGDGDSLTSDDVAQLAELRIPHTMVPAEKDESDMELAVGAALVRGADDLILLGALGGPRLEHALANLWLLALPGLTGRQAVVLDDRSAVRLVGGPDGGEVEFQGEPGDYVSLLPWGGDAEGVTTHGLRYALHGESLRAGPSRGLSNELLGPDARVGVRSGRLLAIHTRRARLGQAPDRRAAFADAPVEAQRRSS